jgi:hypothetical protein
MRLGYAEQYEKACIIVDENDSVEDIIEYAEFNDALYYEGPDPVDDKCFVVQLAGRPKELYTEQSLKRSITKPFKSIAKACA